MTTQTETETILQAETREARPGAAPRRRAHRSWSDIAFGVWGVLVMLFLFLPIIVIVVHSFNTGRLLAVWDGFGFDAFGSILVKPAIQNSPIQNTAATPATAPTNMARRTV